MQFTRVRPEGKSASFVAWYWSTVSHDTTRQEQKIIPDGFPEMIFHYGDPYRIKLKQRWQRQARALLGGQQRKYFFLENTGRSELFGITWKPAALSRLFGLSMTDYTDRVVPLDRVPGPWTPLIRSLAKCRGLEERIQATENFLRPYLASSTETHPVEKCLTILHEAQGSVTMTQLCDEAGITARQLQRMFQTHVGLPPKYYARILRFNRIFSLIQHSQPSWADVVVLSGYYDQSHFIRDFKRFTGEDPTAYPFREESLTNFFTRKTSGRKMSHLSNQP